MTSMGLSSSVLVSGVQLVGGGETIALNYPLYTHLWYIPLSIMGKGNNSFFFNGVSTEPAGASV